MKWGASGMMKNHPYKKYIYAAVSLFGVIVLSIIVFFIIFRYGEIKQALRHIFNTLMPFIIGAALAYMICPLCRTIEKFYLRILEKTERIKQAKKEKLALTASVFTGIFITLVVIYLIIIIIVPQLITSDPSGSDSAGQRGQTGKVVRENVKFQRAASCSFAGAGR